MKLTPMQMLSEPLYVAAPEGSLTKNDVLEDKLKIGREYTIIEHYRKGTKIVVGLKLIESYPSCYLFEDMNGRKHTYNKVDHHLGNWEIEGLIEEDVKVNKNESILIEVDRAVEAIEKWLLRNPNEELRINKYLDDEGYGLTTYYKNLTREKVIKSMTEKGYRVENLTSKNKTIGSRLKLVSGEYQEELEVIVTDTKVEKKIESPVERPMTVQKLSGGILLNLEGMPLSENNIFALRQTLNIFTLLKKQYEIDIIVREVI